MFILLFPLSLSTIAVYFLRYLFCSLLFFILLFNNRYAPGGRAVAAGCPGARSLEGLLMASGAGLHGGIVSLGMCSCFVLYARALVRAGVLLWRGVFAHAGLGSVCHDFVLVRPLRLRHRLRLGHADPRRSGCRSSRLCSADRPGPRRRALLARWFRRLTKEREREKKKGGGGGYFLKKKWES